MAFLPSGTFPRSPGFPQMGMPQPGIAGDMGGTNLGYPQPVVNADGSVGPAGGVGGTQSVNQPNNPVFGAMANLGLSSGGVNNLVPNNPTALIDPVLASKGLGPYGGLADVLASIASADDLQTMYALLSMGQGGNPAMEGFGSEGNFIAGAYGGLLGNQMLPTLGQLLAPAWGNAQVMQGNPNNPLGAMLAGGTPEQQIGSILGIVQQLAGSQMNPLIARALIYGLQRSGQSYSAQQAMEGAGQQTFLQYLANNAPGLTAYLGA